MTKYANDNLRVLRVLAIARVAAMRFEWPSRMHRGLDTTRALSAR